jgi:trehalose 6-phosphate synthase/phosphatase
MPLDVTEDGVGSDLDFVLAISADDQMLRRLNEFDGAETCSTSGKGTDARWRLARGQTLGVLKTLVGVQSP